MFYLLFCEKESIYLDFNTDFSQNFLSYECALMQI